MYMYIYISAGPLIRGDLRGVKLKNCSYHILNMIWKYDMEISLRAPYFLKYTVTLYAPRHLTHLTHRLDYTIMHLIYLRSDNSNKC